MDCTHFLRVTLVFLMLTYVNCKSKDPYSPIAQETEYEPSYDSHESPPHPFNFGYDVLDEHGNKQLRHEEGDHNGHVKGSYGYTDAHGVYRQVDYVADHAGFRAVIQTNEPGLSNDDPADIKLTAKTPPSHIYEQEYKKIDIGHSAPKLYLKAVSKPLYKESSPY